MVDVLLISKSVLLNSQVSSPAPPKGIHIQQHIQHALVWMAMEVECFDMLCIIGRWMKHRQRMLRNFGFIFLMLSIRFTDATEHPRG